MRPEAASFLPLSGSSSFFDPNTALVTHDPDAAFRSMSSSGSSETPFELIMHENVKGLLSQVTELEARCVGLETANAELKTELATIKAARSMNGAHYSPAGNLTGYASSNSSSTPDVDSNAYTEARRNSLPYLVELNDKIEIITAILDSFEKRFEEQNLKQAKFEKSIEYKDREKDWQKGRIGKLEKDFKSLQAEFDDAGVADNRGRFLAKAGDSAADVGSYLVDELHQTQMRLTELTLSCKKEHEELGGKCSALSVIVEGLLEVSASRKGWLPQDSEEDFRTNGTGSGPTKQDVVDLRKWQRDTHRLAKNQQLIDDASTRDALYVMFFQLSEVMSRNRTDSIWVEGSFETTVDEAFQLRDRVLCRLALFNQYDVAFKEVQAKKNDVSW